MIPVPVVGQEIRPWSQGLRGGSKADRTLDSVAVCIPGTISGLSIVTPSSLDRLLNDTTRDVMTLDLTFGQGLAALSSLLVRTESVGSSRIEGIDAEARHVARAIHGTRANASATSIVAAGQALDRLMVAANRGRITLDDILSAHHDLMVNDQHESLYAGRLRPVQIWVGGSDFSPRNAELVPPAPDMVPDLMVDLVDFISREDMPIMVQAAIAHAQFETIHPFTDGNGRIGRALINAIFRMRGLTRDVVVPMASGLVGDLAGYFGDLKTYREGDIEPLTIRFAQATSWAAQEAMATGKVLAEIKETWHSKLGRTRADSAHIRLLSVLLEQPVVNAAQIEEILKVNSNVAYVAIERLVNAGILRPITDSKRNQVWAAGDLIDELFQLDDRIEHRSKNP